MRNINCRYDTVEYRPVWSMNSHRSAGLNWRSRNLRWVKNHKQPSPEPLRQVRHLLKQGLVVTNSVNNSEHTSSLTPQPQRRQPRDTLIATAMAHRRSVLCGVRRFG
jgi:hypothetical protein